MRARRLRLGTAAVLGVLLGCAGEEPGLLLPGRESDTELPPGLTLVARIAHISDTQIVDEESPARFAGAQVITRSAWRPYESYSTQLFDGILRSVNRVHAAGRPIDFLVFTGDACDNAQSNELDWVLSVLDGDFVDPLTGPDDRDAAGRPDPLRDPHAGFLPQGLYRGGVHGELPSIPWYIVYGNHDIYSIGVFPILRFGDGRQFAALPLEFRPGFVLPVRLDPLASFTHGRVTPGDPGPPEFLEVALPVAPNADRAYFDRREFVRALFDTTSGPPGHGFADPETESSWYSVRPVEGLRLIGLDSTDRTVEFPGLFYSEGALSRRQLAYLRDELEAALELGEIVIVLSHHPTSSLDRDGGGEVDGAELRAVLNEFRNVAAHLAGHTHRNRVSDRGGYLEIETASTLDLPQEWRLVEIWRDADGGVVIAYEVFSHLGETLPPLGDDPLRDLRADARDLAAGDKTDATRRKRFDPSGADPYGRPADRRDVRFLPR